MQRREPLSRMDEEIRILQSGTVMAEWKALLMRLNGIGRVERYTEHFEPDGAAAVWLTCHDHDLPDVDRAVMDCLLIEPLYRTSEKERHMIMSAFRHWWRRPVPFII